MTLPKSAVFQEDLYVLSEKTTIILSQPWADIPEEEKLLLEKILLSVRLTLAAVRVIHQPTLDIAQLNVRPARVVYFGPPVKGLPEFEILPAAETSLLVSAPLADLQKDQQAKQKLWVVLKQFFGL